MHQDAQSQEKPHLDTLLLITQQRSEWEGAAVPTSPSRWWLRCSFICTQGGLCGRRMPQQFHTGPYQHSHTVLGRRKQDGAFACLTSGVKRCFFFSPPSSFFSLLLLPLPYFLLAAHSTAGFKSILPGLLLLKVLIYCTPLFIHLLVY